jgi:hypothetical protein
MSLMAGDSGEEQTHHTYTSCILNYLDALIETHIAYITTESYKIG